MEGTAGDPKSAEPNDKSAAGYQKSTGPNFRSQSDKQRGVDRSGCDKKQGNVESRSTGSDEKRVPPGPHLPLTPAWADLAATTRMGVLGRGALRATTSVRSLIHAFPHAHEFRPRARAPSLTLLPPRVDASGGFLLTSSAPFQKCLHLRPSAFSNAYHAT